MDQEEESRVCGSDSSTAPTNCLQSLVPNSFLALTIVPACPGVQSSRSPGQHPGVQSGPGPRLQSRPGLCPRL